MLDLILIKCFTKEGNYGYFAIDQDTFDKIAADKHKKDGEFNKQYEWQYVDIVTIPEFSLNEYRFFFCDKDDLR